MLNIKQVNNDFSVCPLITADDLAEIAALGFKTVINNRPDNEGGADQPASSTIQAKAEQLGLSYFYIPVIPNNVQASEVDTFEQAFSDAPKPILGFCRTGNRATKMLALMQAK